MLFSHQNLRFHILILGSANFCYLKTVFNLSSLLNKENSKNKRAVCPTHVCSSLTIEILIITFTDPRLTTKDCCQEDKIKRYDTTWNI